MSINGLVKEEAQRQIDLAIEEIPSDSSKLSTPYSRVKIFYWALNTDILQGCVRAITRTRSNNLEEEYQKRKRDR